MQQIIWEGKNKELTVPRVLLWPTFFSPMEMLPVERVVVDWERSAKLAPLYSLTSLNKYPKLALLHPWDLGQSCLNKIGAAHHWPSSVWIGWKSINLLMSYIKPQIQDIYSKEKPLLAMFISTSNEHILDKTMLKICGLTICLIRVLVQWLTCWHCSLF